MEQNQQKKFVCKFCHKRYPCGKSLGGHIRIHLNNHKHVSAEADEEDEIELIGNGGLINSGGSGQSSYVLRENPRKTKRFVDSSGVFISKHREEMTNLLCKDCGKGFPSLKALCGHMACHSEKGNNNNNKLIKTRDLSSEQNLVMDDESDTENSSAAPSRRSTRSKRMRFVGAYDSNSSFNGNYSSSENMEQEQEEVAMCLIMLSRDSGFKRAWNLVADSSDNNSVVLETKSSSTDLRINAKNGNNMEMMMKKIGKNKLKSAKNELSEDSDSGYFNNGPKDDDDGNGMSYEFTRPKKVFRSGFEEFEEDDDENDDAELGKKLKRFKLVKKPAVDHKRNEGYECLVCNKVFHSHRSLWGHQASHSKVKGCSYDQSNYGSGENSITENENHSIRSSKVENQKLRIGNVAAKKRLGGGSKKSKGHECPICFRMFKSGQALGGHKRSHFMATSADNETVVINHKIPSLIDLNLPAPDDDDEENPIGHAGW
ncbi:uncharacterized protein [Rutidosis leptorrhynchoides]|uniref:uncharacterized protein n=1 Tax=Rutidosis leptorrhynchoides TaxID=125765 RepID=UPI003A993193